jgi:integrase
VEGCGGQACGDACDGSSPSSRSVWRGARSERPGGRHDGDDPPPVGRHHPINPSTDYHQWKRLLVDAGLREGRLHDARHTAATVLLILGVSERAVMGIMGWSTTAMAARYQHVTGIVRGDVAQRVGALIWGSEGRE